MSSERENLPENYSANSSNITNNLIHNQNQFESQNNNEKESFIDQGQKCSICLDMLTNIGDHRICNLKCGHIFGQNCIKRWLLIKKVCPECKTKASEHEIRIIYATSLVVTDTREIEKLNEEVYRLKLKEKMYRQQLICLKQTISYLDNKKIINICHDNNCKCMKYNKWHKKLFVTSYNKIHSIPIETLSDNLNLNCLHNKQIYDLTFGLQSNALLSVGHDKKIMVLDIHNNLPIHVYDSNIKLWSCCWSNYNSNIFFIGGSNGFIFEYDMRYLQSSVFSTQIQAHQSPILSVASIPASDLSSYAGGYITCQSHSCYVWDFIDATYTGSLINYDGLFTNLQYIRDNNEFLISCRRGSKIPFVRYFICSLNRYNDIIDFNTKFSFHAGNYYARLSRPCYVQNLSMILASNDELQSVVAWDLHTEQQIYQIPMPQYIRDICYLENVNFQTILTINDVHLYNFSIND